MELSNAVQILSVPDVMHLVGTGFKNQVQSITSCDLIKLINSHRDFNNLSVLVSKIDPSADN